MCVHVGGLRSTPNMLHANLLLLPLFLVVLLWGGSFAAHRTVRVLHIPVPVAGAAERRLRWFESEVHNVCRKDDK